MADEQGINEGAAAFVASIKQLMPSYQPNQVFNTDQSGFNKELHSKGTLRFKGAKQVTALIQSEHAMTHSYTIQPLISADGTLHSPLFIILQEENGKFGPRVAQTMARPGNLHIKCTRSGIVTKQIIHEWFLEIYFETAPGKSLLLVDSLPSYVDRVAINELKPVSVDYEVRVIPKHTTGKIQPLDKYFFLQWKTFAKKIGDHVVNEDVDISLFQRDNILILQSLIHDQFTAPRFKTFVKQSWIKCGYMEGTEDYDTPDNWCFIVTSSCSNDDCGKDSLIRCAHCEKELCFDHFFISRHVRFSSDVCYDGKNF